MLLRIDILRGMYGEILRSRWSLRTNFLVGNLVNDKTPNQPELRKKLARDGDFVEAVL